MAKQSLTMPPFDCAKNGPKLEALATLEKKGDLRVAPTDAINRVKERAGTGACPYMS